MDLSVLLCCSWAFIAGYNGEPVCEYENLKSSKHGILIESLFAIIRFLCDKSNCNVDHPFPLLLR